MAEESSQYYPWMSIIAIDMGILSGFLWPGGIDCNIDLLEHHVDGYKGPFLLGNNVANMVC